MAGGAVAVGATLGFAGAAKADDAGQVLVNYVDSIPWNAEYDVVVVGWGGAGSVAAITAAEQGARVLLTEKAPMGHHGGNTRYCEQYFCIPNSYEDGVAFFGAMAKGFDTATDEVIDFMARGSIEIEEWLYAHGAKEFADGSPATGNRPVDPNRVPRAEQSAWIHENPDGTRTMSEYPVWPDGTLNDGRICEFMVVDPPDHEEKHYWNLLCNNVEALKDSIDVWVSSPAKHLIQDPYTKTILGVQIERDGQVLNVRAKNGVVLACGSYEANQEMFENYAQLPCALPIGSLYNTGDGITMGLEVGADLWHMDALSGPWILPKFPNEDRAFFNVNIAGQRITTEGNCIYVGGNAQRFMNESGTNKHGHVEYGGSWISQITPDVMWAIMDSTARNGAGTITVVSEEELVEAPTIEELAEAIGLDSAALADTVARWNDSVAAGVDERFERMECSLAPIESAPFYAVRLWPACVNAQGGPKRNVSCEVLDPNGNPIPRLYSAGELGSFWAGVYICGGNIAETVYSGREAGMNAAIEKGDPEPVAIFAATQRLEDYGSDLEA